MDTGFLANSMDAGFHCEEVSFPWTDPDPQSVLCGNSHSKHQLDPLMHFATICQCYRQTYTDTQPIG